MDDPSPKMNIIIEKWDSLVTPDMEIDLDESILPEPLQHLLQQLRSSKPVRFFDQSKNPYDLQREVRAWSVPHPDYFHALGLNRQIIIKEIKTQHDNANKQPRNGKEAL